MRAGNRWICKSCLAGLLLGLSLVITPVRAETNVVDLVVAAIAAGEAEDWGQAVDLYGQALELEPNNAGLHNNLGVVLRRQGELSGAIEAYQRATELDPNLSAAYVNLGLALLLQQRWQEALTALQAAAEQIPDEATLLFYQGIALENLENWPAAIETYNAYLRESPDALGHYRLAIVYWQAGDPQRAVELFQRAARLEAEVGLYSSEAGRALALLGQWQDAAILLERLPERWMDPADFLILARIAYHLDRVDLADQALKRALAVTSAGAADEAVNPALLNDMGVVEGERQNLELATQFLEAAVAQLESQNSDPDVAAVANTNLADLYIAQANWEQALIRAQMALEWDPTLAQAHNTLAAVLLQQRQLQTAIRHWQEATQLDPNYWQAHRNLSLAYALNGEQQVATQQMQLAMEKAPTLDIVEQLNQELRSLPEVVPFDPDQEASDPE